MSTQVTAIITCMTDSERRFLRETLQSVFSQTLPCESIVVVLESNSWIAEMAAEFPRLQVVRRSPGRAGAARNTGIAVARTEFVAFLDGDDVWLPTKTERQVAFLWEGQRDFVGVDHMLLTEEGKPFAYGLARYLPMTSSWMVRRETMLRYPFDPDISTGDEDGRWWLSTFNTVRKSRLPQPLIGYRVRDQSLSTASPSKRRKLALANISKLPPARLMLLGATYALHRMNQRVDYLLSKDWPMPATTGNANR